MPPADELLNRVTWKIPNALVLVGSAAGDERNGMTTSWVTQLSMEPVLIGIGVYTVLAGGGSDAEARGSKRSRRRNQR